MPLDPLPEPFAVFLHSFFNSPIPTIQPKTLIYKSWIISFEIWRSSRQNFCALGHYQHKQHTLSVGTTDRRKSITLVETRGLVKTTKFTGKLSKKEYIRALKNKVLLYVTLGVVQIFEQSKLYQRRLHMEHIRATSLPAMKRSSLYTITTNARVTRQHRKLWQYHNAIVK